MSDNRVKKGRPANLPSSLLAVLQAARRAGEQELEQDVTAELRDVHGIIVTLDPRLWPRRKPLAMAEP